MPSLRARLKAVCLCCILTFCQSNNLRWTRLGAYGIDSAYALTSQHSKRCAGAGPPGRENRASFCAGQPGLLEVEVDKDFINPRGWPNSLGAIPGHSTGPILRSQTVRPDADDARGRDNPRFSSPAKCRTQSA